MSGLKRESIVNFLDNPETGFAVAYAIISLLLIFLTLFAIAFELQAPIFVKQHGWFFSSLEILILGFFSFDLTLRIICYKNRLKYLTSFYGVVDVLTVVPGLIGIFIPLGINTTWIRLLRIFRLWRAIPIIQLVGSENVVAGLSGRVLPFMGAALGLKVLTLVLEDHEWWPTIGNLSVVLGVVGFALAILLGAKLSVVNGRLYAIEDAVCRIVGALRMLRANSDISQEVTVWANQFEENLRNPDKTGIRNMREQTEALAVRLEAGGVRGPNVAGFHRDVAYVLHRATAEIPVAYEAFLRYVTISYTAAVVLVVPGLTGVIASALVVYALVGAYFLVEDMDSPLSFDKDSYIRADLEPLSQFNEY